MNKIALLSGQEVQVLQLGRLGAVILKGTKKMMVPRTNLKFIKI